MQSEQRSESGNKRLVWPADEGEAWMPVGRSGRDHRGHFQVEPRSPNSMQGSGLWVGACLGQSTQGCFRERALDETGPLMGRRGCHVHKLSGLGLLELPPQLERIVKAYFASLPEVVSALLWEKGGWGKVT